MVLDFVTEVQPVHKIFQPRNTERGLQTTEKQVIATAEIARAYRCATIDIAFIYTTVTFGCSPDSVGCGCITDVEKKKSDKRTQLELVVKVAIQFSHNISNHSPHSMFSDILD